MIHQYKNNGYNIVLDVCSGAVHVVDDLCYDVISVLNGQEKDYTAEELKAPEVYSLAKTPERKRRAKRPGKEKFPCTMTLLQIPSRISVRSWNKRH